VEAAELSADKVGDFGSRFAIAEEYLLAVEAPGLDWHDDYRLLLAQQLPFPRAMALAHPSWFPGGLDRRIIQGKASFDPPRRSSSDVCRSQVLWGYNCPFTGRAFHADHLFPYSAGGPTEGSNYLLLCEVHNRFKSGDIHLFPWELGEPGWLRPMLSRMRPFLGKGAGT
jgi:hypothetical protein